MTALFGFLGALIGGFLAFTGNIWIENHRERTRIERSLKALLAELDFDLQLLGGIKGGELHYTKLEHLIEFSAYEQARDSGALYQVGNGISMEIASARFELMVFCEIATKNPSLPFPNETSTGDDYNLNRYLEDGHARLSGVSGRLEAYLDTQTKHSGSVPKRLQFWSKNP